MLLDALLIFGYALVCIASLAFKQCRMAAFIGLAFMSVSAAAAELMSRFNTPSDCWRLVMMIIYFAWFILASNLRLNVKPVSAMACTVSVVSLFIFVPAGAVGDAIDTTYAILMTLCHLWYISSIFKDLEPVKNDLPAGSAANLARDCHVKRGAK